MTILGSGLIRAASVAGGGWWDDNGAISGCIGAWAPKGAASFAASLLDLSGNSADCTDGNSTAWDTTNGWKGDSSSDYILTPITPVDGYSIIVRFSNGPTSDAILDALFGSEVQQMSCLPRFNSQKYWGNGGAWATGGGTATSGVLCMTDTDGYLDGADVTNITAALSTSYAMCFLCVNGASPARFSQCYIQAAAMYDTSLSAADVSTISTAMAAL